MDKVIFMVDMESFFASVERANHPELSGRPLLVSGDPERRSGVILAACPVAKARGVTNGERLWEAQQKCPEAVVVRPHMQQYVTVSVQITEILERFTDLIEPFSIDEQFMDVTHSQRLFGAPREIAQKVQQAIWHETGVRARIGMGESKVLAKMACDNFAKKMSSGVFHLTKERMERLLWPLPIECLYGVGRQMTKHFRNQGIRTIGQLANTSLERIKGKWGVNGHVLWLTAHGIDPSPVTPHSHDKQKGIGHGMTLPHDYVKAEDIHVVLLELCEEVCKRARRAHLMGRTVAIGVSGANMETPTGFHRQMKLTDHTNITMEVYEGAATLFERFWDGKPIRRLHVNLSNLTSDEAWQLSFFGNRDRAHQLGYTMDTIKEKFGDTAIRRAVSFLSASQAEERAKKIGGHYK
ncbi:DNA polymerase IV [Halalkalibacterium halodurans]|uniref:DNA polymerase IV n=1 Tax=Halalkalibacterium halodurans TaxID=86665 RepID=UPI002AA9B60A|nr:DNA polymerase IV [Halalkalibacterium halodurans]MDY7223272.1 DNA polymerase IV [Halalkalibacterium halodurans]MDY7242493.1 DNA polymerase IV [Halalkalibacterium halodurans]